MNNSREAEIWRGAWSLDGLCLRTERWLRGELRWQPGYNGPVDVDEDQPPGLTAACIALNRVGFLTQNSQAGFDGIGYDGKRWTQSAGVDGFTTPQAVEALRRRLPPAFTIHAASSLDNAYWQGRVCSGLAVNSATDKADLWSWEAVRDVSRGVSFVIYDPIPGPNALWAELSAACTTAGSS